MAIDRRTKMKRAAIALLATASLWVAFAADGIGLQRPPAPSEELNTILMHATFSILGQKRNEPGKVAFGTVFIMGIPFKSDPKTAHIVLVTAAHVLDDIGSDQATLMVRRKNDDGTYTAFPHMVPIRTNGHPLYVKHTSADVAAMYVDLPDEVPITGLPPDFLADDKRLEEIDLHPGDEAFVLGFPLFASGPGGFPILRSGHIASFPLTPMKNVKQFHFDLFIFGGNSGGPVYYSFVNRFFKGHIQLGVFQGLLGLVIQETRSALPGFTDKALNFGVVVPAAFIRETIDMLPALPDDVTGSVP
jgi:trypsin-like peptidase